MKREWALPLLAGLLVAAGHFGFSLYQAAQHLSSWVALEEHPALSAYLRTQTYWRSYAYGLAAGLTLHALLRSQAVRTKGILGALGGVTLAALLPTLGCFLVGCCGSPLLPIYLSLFGGTIVRLENPLIALLTTLSAAWGLLWLSRRSRLSCPVTPECSDCGVEQPRSSIEKIK